MGRLHRAPPFPFGGNSANMRSRGRRCQQNQNVLKFGCRGEIGNELNTLVGNQELDSVLDEERVTLQPDQGIGGKKKRKRSAQFIGPSQEVIGARREDW